jgi:hypothetical protein
MPILVTSGKTEDGLSDEQFDERLFCWSRRLDSRIWKARRCFGIVLVLVLVPGKDMRKFDLEGFIVAAVIGGIFWVALPILWKPAPALEVRVLVSILFAFAAYVGWRRAFK